MLPSRRTFRVTNYSPLFIDTEKYPLVMKFIGNKQTGRDHGSTDRRTPHRRDG